MTRARSSERAIRFEPVAKTPEPELAGVLDALSHDLRNPLGTITLGATLLLDQFGLDPRARRSLEMIQRAAHRIQDLSERLTDLASISSRHLQLELEEVKAADLVASALVDKTVAVESTLEGITVRCDKTRAGEVIAMAVGERLRAAGEPVRIRASRRQTQALFVIVEAAAWRSFEHVLAQGIIVAHGGELWREGSNVFFTLPLAS